VIPVVQRQPVTFKEKSLAPPPNSPHPADPAFAFLSINFHLAFKKPSIFPRGYI
jgi:hypothetical protein